MTTNKTVLLAIVAVIGSIFLAACSVHPAANDNGAMANDNAMAKDTTGNTMMHDDMSNSSMNDSNGSMMHDDSMTQDDSMMNGSMNDSNGSMMHDDSMGHQ